MTKCSAIRNKGKACKQSKDLLPNGRCKYHQSPKYGIPPTNLPPIPESEMCDILSKPVVIFPKECDHTGFVGKAFCGDCGRELCDHMNFFWEDDPFCGDCGVEMNEVDWKDFFDEYTPSSYMRQSVGWGCGEWEDA